MPRRWADFEVFHSLPLRKKPPVAVDFVELVVADTVASFGTGAGVNDADGGVAGVFSLVDEHAAFFVVLQIERHLMAFRKQR